MQAFPKDRKIILNRIRYAYKLFVLLDLDGTLLPLSAGTAPKLKPKERAVLEGLLTVPETHVGVVSERPLDQVSKAVHVPGVHYSASLGLEYAPPRGPLVQLAMDDLLAEYESFVRALKRRAARTKGAVVDRLALRVSVDWSKAAAGPRKDFAMALKELETSHAGAIRTLSGKQVADYLPQTGYEKGTAAVAILRKVGFNLKSDLALYMGDDVTDEDAFLALKELGVTVRVGRPKPTSAAHYALKNPTEVWSLLKTIIETRGAVREGDTPAARMF